MQILGMREFAFRMAGNPIFQCVIWHLALREILLVMDTASIDL